MRRLLTLIAFTLVMILTMRIYGFHGDAASELTFSGVVLGFVLISGFLFGEVAAAVNLPRITGYLIIGMFFGPHAVGFLGAADQKNLEFIELLAISLIALTAGGEFEIGRIKPLLKSILFVTLFQVLVVFGGMALFFLAVSDLFPVSGLLHAGDLQTGVLVSMGLLLGVVAIASSPSAAIAIVVETESRGPVTDTIMGVTVLKDMVLLVLFAVVLSLSETLMGVESGGTKVNLIWEMGGSFFGGGLLALILYLYIRFVKAETPIFILGVAFLGVKVSETINFHPLLVCMTAGFLVRNLTAQGGEMIKAIEKGSPPVYVLFFFLAGSRLDVGLLFSMAFPAVLFSVFRIAATYLSSLAGAVLAGYKTRGRFYMPLGFIPMAGVSIGIATVVYRRFPVFGEDFMSLVLAVIVIKQLIGPAVMKWVLSSVGETSEMRGKGNRKPV